LLGAVAVVALLAGGLVRYLDPVAPVATGYAAKTVCSATFLSGRSVDDALGDLPDNPLVPFLLTSRDASEGTVTTTLLGGWGSTAHVSAYGCTLADDPPDLPPFTGVGGTGDTGTPWPEGGAPAAVPDGVRSDVLDAAVDGAFAEDDPQGRARNTRAVVVAHDGHLVAERYGEGFDADTPLLGWSMAKSVANAIVGRLVHEGLLDVADDDLLPRWSGDDRAAITVEHLLTMTDGLAFEEVYDPDTDATRMLFLPGSTGGYAADQPLVAEPGTQWAYSSGTTNILCDVAQSASGSGPELADELVFDPVGMRSAVLEADADGGLVCSSFLYATARDWARFGQWFLQDGVWHGERLLPEGWVETSTAPVAVSGETPYGWKWWPNEGADGKLRMPSVPADAYWASGNEGQHLVVVPSADLVVVRLGFSGAFDGLEWGLEPLVAGAVEAVTGTGHDEAARRPAGPVGQAASP
ncbi:MAG: serine hydrolase, partial [Egibacteraceae bacterium]